MKYFKVIHRRLTTRLGVFKVRTNLHSGVDAFFPAKIISQSGRSMIEMLVVLLMAAILMSMAIGDLRQLNDPLQNSSAQLASFFSQARGKAISQTVAYHVSAISATKMVTTYGNTCTSPAVNDSTLTLTLPAGAKLADFSWSICFNSRGLSDQDLTTTLTQNGRTKTVEVLLGGGVRAR